MTTTLNIALLTASGVSEHEMTAIQRALASARLRARVISPESGLIHSWGEGTWGHCYPSDAKLEVTLGSDYDALILPGGTRHIDKLMSNPHTKRVVSAFFAGNKPVAVFPDALKILETYGLSGDNALILSYADSEGLVDAASQMIAHIETAEPAELAEAA